MKPGLQGSAASAELATPSARATQSGIPRQVVFLPTCVNRMMGAARGDTEYKGSTLEVFTRLANKAGYQVIVPKVRSVNPVSLNPAYLPLQTSRQKFAIAIPAWCHGDAGAVPS